MFGMSPGPQQSRFGGGGLTSNGQSPFVYRAGPNMDAAPDTVDALAGNQNAAVLAQPSGQAQGQPSGFQRFLRGFTGQGGATAPAQSTGFQNAVGGMQPGLKGLMALSDSRSKQKIADLEAVKQRYEDLLDGPPAAMPQTRQPDTTALDEAFRRPGQYSYEYKDPTMAGAAPGQQVGPMADELRGIPGVVAPGADGLDRVHTPRLTMANTSQIAKQRRELDELHQRLADLSDQGDTDGVLRAAAGGR